MYYSASASGADKCAWGESYWCSNIKVAKDCGAIEHCKSTVWKNKELSKSNDEICQFCESIIQDARDMISQKSTQEEIQQLLDSACSVIPDQSIASECQDMVNQYLAEVISIVESELDPQMVCSLLGLCSGLEDKVRHAQLLRAKPISLDGKLGGDICVDCKQLVTDLKAQFTSATTEKEVEDLLKQQLCSQLGPLADECNQLVEAYVPQIFDMLATQLDPDMLCQALGLCNQTSPMAKTLFARKRLEGSSLFKMAQLTDSAECDVCKTVIGELQSLERQKQTQEQVETFLKQQICARLGSIESVCDQTIDTYGPELFEILASELDPSTVCNAIGFCSASPVRIATPAKNTPKKKVKASAQCVLCEFVMKEVDQMLESNATQEEILKALDTVCSILPDTIKAQCTDFVDTYGPAVLILLEQELSPELVCTTIGLCSANGKVRTGKPVIKLPAGLKGDEMCGVCETVIQYVDGLLEQNATIQEIEATLEKVCNFLPGNLRQECDTIIEQYGPAIVQLLAQFADPKEVCQSIGLCSQSSKPVPIEEIKPAKANLVGVSECTYGPAFWCASQENAVKCKATEHCKKHVWDN